MEKILGVAGFKKRDEGPCPRREARCPGVVTRRSGTASFFKPNERRCHTCLHGFPNYPSRGGEYTF